MLIVIMMITIPAITKMKAKITIAMMITKTTMIMIMKKYNHCRNIKKSFMQFILYPATRIKDMNHYNLHIYLLKGGFIISFSQRLSFLQSIGAEFYLPIVINLFSRCF